MANEGQFEAECRLISMFIDNAKTYIQLSSGALAFSIVFLREVLSVPETDPMPIDWFLLMSWICFLVTVGAGVFYQYLGVKYLEARSEVSWERLSGLGRVIDRPWPVYLVMMVAFYLGAILFAVAAIKSMG